MPGLDAFASLPVHTPEGVSEGAPRLTPLMAHALDQDSSEDEGDDLSGLYESNFERTVDYDEEEAWINELDEALGDGPALQLVPSSSPPVVPSAPDGRFCLHGTDERSQALRPAGHQLVHLGPSATAQAPSVIIPGLDPGRQGEDADASSPSPSPASPKFPLLSRGNAVEFFSVSFGAFREPTPKCGG